MMMTFSYTVAFVSRRHHLNYVIGFLKSLGSFTLAFFSLSLTLFIFACDKRK